MARDSPGQCYFSIQEYVLIGLMQRERRDLNIKTLTCVALHLIGTAHHPRRGVERRATCIFKALTGLQDWLLPYNPRPFDFGEFAARICNHPVPAQQLDRFVPLILNGHAISPEILRLVRRGLCLEVSWLNADRDSSSSCRVVVPICHRATLDERPGPSQRGVIAAHHQQSYGCTFGRGAWRSGQV